MKHAAIVRKGMLVLGLACGVAACAMREGVEAQADVSPRAPTTACERLDEFDPTTLTNARSRLEAELDAAARASMELQLALARLPASGASGDALDAIAATRGRLLAAQSDLLPEVAGAADDGAKLRAWVALVEDGVPLRMPADPDHRAQALRLALLSSALGLPMQAPTRLANYFRRLDNLGGFIAQAREGDRRADDSLRTAAFDLHGNFSELERRYRIVLLSDDAHWADACRRPRTAIHKGMGGQ